VATALYDFWQGQQERVATALDGRRVELLAARNKRKGQKKAKANPDTTFIDEQGVLAGLDWDAEYNAMLAALRVMMEQALAAGLTAVADQIYEALAVPISWDIYDKVAADLARTYTYDLIRDLTDSTRKMLGQEVSTWIAGGESFESLVQRTRQVLPSDPTGQGLRDRGRLVAQTEMTRIFADSHMAGQQAAGLTKVRWRTADDEIVCIICGALGRANDGDGAIGDVSSKLFTNPEDGEQYEMPSHPGCRCYCVEDRQEMEQAIGMNPQAKPNTPPGDMGFDWYQPQLETSAAWQPL
jgi:hypothetical protein